MSTVTETMRSWVTRPVVEDRRGRAAIGLAAFVLATSFGAHVAVPLPWTPVPMTLQPLFVILAGALLGPWLGAGAMATYLAVGAAGAPVFSFGGAGLPWLLGPTGGYLIAYPAAAFVVGWIAGRGAGTLRLTAALTAGIATLYVGGISQLFLLTGESLGALLAVGAAPFLLGDLTKIAMALVLARLLRPTSPGA
jgi:biotin transport system substrate-specific component